MYIYINICIYLKFFPPFTCMHTQAYLHTHTYTYIHPHIFTHAYIHTCIHTYMYAFTYIYIYIYTYICIYIYILRIPSPSPLGAAAPQLPRVNFLNRIRSKFGPEARFQARKHYVVTQGRSSRTNMYMCIYLHAYMHTCVHTYVHICMHLFITV